METWLEMRAGPDVVWSVLTSFADWGSWNPVIPEVTGRLGVGEDLEIRVVLRGRRVPVSVRIVSLVPGCELAWRGGVAGLFQATHGFRVVPSDVGTRFEHYEHFRGVVPFVVWPLLSRMLHPRYLQTNRALQERAESLSHSD